MTQVALISPLTFHVRTTTRQSSNSPHAKKHPRMTTLDVANTTNPLQGVTGVKNQASAAVPPMALMTTRNALFVGEFEPGPARKLYPQSHRSALSGLTNPQLGHSFIEEANVQCLLKVLREVPLSNKQRKLTPGAGLQIWKFFLPVESSLKRTNCVFSSIQSCIGFCLVNQCLCDVEMLAHPDIPIDQFQHHVWMTVRQIACLDSQILQFVAGTPQLF
jgi:hypothetical protein